MRKEISKQSLITQEKEIMPIELNISQQVKNWLNIVYHGNYDRESMKSMYLGILESPNDGLDQTLVQIKRDIIRTYPNHPLFRKDSEGYLTLEKLLIAYCKYDRCIGYVQGMNFIMGSLMFYCKEPDIWFWLFVSLIEQYQLWDNYKGDLKGITKHWEIIKLMLDKEIPKLSEHFDKNQMNIEMFAMDWILGLFSSIIPLKDMSFFYDNFFQEKWLYFYKIVMVYLKDVQAELLQEEEMCDVLFTLKTLATPLRNDYSPMPGDRSFKSTVLSTLNKESKDNGESYYEIYDSPKKKGAFRIFNDLIDIFTKKQYDCDWMSILKRAQTYKVKDLQQIKDYSIKYDLTH